MRGPLDPATGMLVDLAVLRAAIAAVRERLDHHFLDEVAGLPTPTLEHLCCSSTSTCAPPCRRWPASACRARAAATAASTGRKPWRAAARKAAVASEPAALAARSLRAVWHPCTQMKQHEAQPLLPIARAEGVWLYDFDGRRYLDAISSWWVNLFGHGHPRINAALAEQLGALEHVMLAGFTHEPVVRAVRAAGRAHRPRPCLLRAATAPRRSRSR